MQPGAVTELLRSLRAVRRFAPDPIPDAVLQDILEVGRWTGSAKNTQPWQLIVVRDRATLGTLATCGPYAGHIAGATLAIGLVMKDGQRRFDEGRLAEALMVAAWAHGVGSCIGSLYPDDNAERARQALDVPPSRWLRSMLSLGYPADAAALRLSAAPGNLASVPLGRQPVSDLVHWERWGQRTDDDLTAGSPIRSEHP